ncbi:TPA: hypothetical protein N0F65_005650 [Lagenidium giganteum]|uniref:Uncharacterized protein n=1 Tax=Lagenidium giganteum TaxID=4803 RepID=A0AAV2ZCP9_9STRA|nr:TPA: hypothetical protein N0F65_005650 [Lagenidium giganteum]
MVAHAIFTSSRRNGVQGISFNDFFACLLGEIQGELWRKVEMHCGDTHRIMSASDLFEGYAEDVTNVSKKTIPFLAPPNAKWPPFISDTNRNGCRFGHLVRACTTERCDVLRTRCGDGERKRLSCVSASTGTRMWTCLR